VNVEIPPNVPLSEVGKIHAIIEDTVVVEASVSGEYKVLDMDSILLFEDRSVLGRVFDTFGPVSKPMYSVRFNHLKEIQELNVSVGQRIFYIPDLASFVFTQPLKALKGTDASNLYDEEVGEEVHVNERLMY
jgi:H/ACA ribonucleoprotein complex non-core subunit NAF1